MEGGGYENPDVEYYFRYWHGFLVFLKPILCMFNYREIRMIMGICQIIIIIGIIYMLYKRNRSLYITPIVLTWLYLNPLALMKSLQYNSMFMVTYLSVFFLLWKYDLFQNKNIWTYLFIVIGCLTSYFDYLTYPLITFGIPFVLLITLYKDTPKENIITMFKCGISWVAGYICMWAGDWIIASIILKKEAFLNAAYAIHYRINGKYRDYGSLEMIIRAILVNSIRVVWFIPVVLICVIMIYRYVRKNGNYLDVVPYIIVMVLPYMWYVVAGNHSCIHGFTYRALTITLFAATMYIADNHILNFNLKYKNV